MAKSVTYKKTFDGVERERVAYLPAEHRQLEAEGWEALSGHSKSEEPSPRTRRTTASESAESAPEPKA